MFSCVINMIMDVTGGREYRSTNTQEMRVEENKWYSHLHNFCHITRSC